MTGKIGQSSQRCLFPVIFQVVELAGLQVLGEIDGIGKVRRIGNYINFIIELILFNELTDWLPYTSPEGIDTDSIRVGNIMQPEYMLSRNLAKPLQKSFGERSLVTDLGKIRIVGIAKRSAPFKNRY